MTWALTCTVKEHVLSAMLAEKRREKRTRAVVWFDLFKNIYTIPSHLPCFPFTLECSYLTQRYGVTCSSRSWRRAQDLTMRRFYRDHWTDNEVNHEHKAKSEGKKREGMQNLRAMNRYHRATLNNTLQHRDRKLGQCQSSRVGGRIYCK